MVAGRYIPVKVVLREHVYYVVVGKEGNLFGVERAEERGRQEAVERAGAPNGEYQLHERGVDVFLGAALCLGPQERFWLEQFRPFTRRGNAEVYVAYYLRAVECCKVVVRHFVFQFLLFNVSVFRHYSWYFKVICKDIKFPINECEMSAYCK